MTEPVLNAPRKLQKGDRGEKLSSFCSGVDELDEWFHKFAWESQAANNAVTYVATLDDGTIVGFYALCSAGISREHAPAKFAQGKPKDIPCILLARLAVDQRFQGRRLGRHLLRDAISRAITASESIAAACLLIHAHDDAAKAFYLKNADFLESPVNELHLVLPIKTDRQLGFGAG